MKTMILAALLLLSISAGGFDLIETAQTLRERAWMSEYIPESTDETVPLTEYEDFEVVELFRAETIDELEASLADGYPYPWLEETLMDESIPWEDRYWLDRRVRAAISQNLHVFYDTGNNPVHVDADAVFPGEYYWREHMIVDLVGLSIPEGTERPTRFEHSDVGYLYNPYGEREGQFAFAMPYMSISRDGSVSVVAGLSLNYEVENAWDSFEFLMLSDGSYRHEFDLDQDYTYDAVVSPDGNTIVFCQLRESSEENSEVFVFDKDGDLLNSFSISIPLSHSWVPVISEDGRYVCHAARGTDACLIDCISGTAEVVSERTEYYRNCSMFNFSPDGKYLCLGGSTTARMLNISTDENTFYLETHPISQSEDHPFSTVMASNSGNCVTLTTRRGERPIYSREVVVKIDGITIFDESIPIKDDRGSFQTDVSPNGYFLIMNPVKASYGAPDYRNQVEEISSYGTPYNLPYVFMQIVGR
jgi:hypothetical protein